MQIGYSTNKYLSIPRLSLNLKPNGMGVKYFRLQLFIKQSEIPHGCSGKESKAAERVIDGNSYEKSAITEWLTKHRNSPITREEMELEH